MHPNHFAPQGQETIMRTDFDNIIERAWDRVVEDATKAEGCYVVLFCDRPYYGGPEEGGWWGTDNLVVSYRRCSTQEEAEAILTKMDEEVKNLNREADLDHGHLCLAQCARADAMGVEVESLYGEDSGSLRFRATITQELPRDYYGNRFYE